MKVKIIKSYTGTMWYADKIGDIFEIEVKNKRPILYDDMYKIKQNSKYSPSFIYVEDCELL